MLVAMPRASASACPPHSGVDSTVLTRPRSSVSSETVSAAEQSGRASHWAMRMTKDPESWFHTYQKQSGVVASPGSKVAKQTGMDIAKLAGVDAVKLVLMIVQAARMVRHNKKTCQQLVQHVQIIGNLLEKLQTLEMMQHPEIRNGLCELEEILREAYMLVASSQNGNYIYHLFTGKKQADRFRILQNRIDSCLQVFPLISHINTADRLDQILEIIRPPLSQDPREVPRLFTGHSSCDISFKAVNSTKFVTGNKVRVREIISGMSEVCGEVKRCSLQHAGMSSKRLSAFSNHMSMPGNNTVQINLGVSMMFIISSEFFKFNLSQLVDATNNFSDENRVGQGSFGCVYKGQLHDGVEVAVKRCFELPSPNQLDAQDLEFQNEICFLTKLEHTSIIKLLGACMQGRERVLVYEYMLNGSLDTFFGTRTRRLCLDWATRFQIIKGITEGLLYLHKHSGLYIIHGDLKPSNILLDTNMKPKISDFGLARMYNPGVDQEFADHIVGSIGFIAPECRERRLFSIKSDVYGFGALLLEIISGKRCFSLASGESGDDHGFLNKRVWHLWRAGRLIEFLDSRSPPGDESERMEILRCIQIALLCVEENPANRPAMQEIVHMLSCQNVVLPIPQRPAYLRAEMVHAHS